MSGGNGRIARIPPISKLDLAIAASQLKSPEERYPVEHRIRVTITATVRTARQLTEAELLEAGRHVGLGTPTSVEGYAGPIPDSLALEIEIPECQDVEHRRNSIDGKTYMCGFPAADGIHLSVDLCEAERGEPCDLPEQHHDFVSPGFEGPAS